MRLKDNWYNDREFLLPFFNKLIGNEKNWKCAFMTTVPNYDITCQLDNGKKRAMNIFKIYNEAAIFFTGAKLEVVTEAAEPDLGDEGNFKLVTCEGYDKAMANAQQRGSYFARQRKTFYFENNKEELDNAPTDRL